MPGLPASADTLLCFAEFLLRSYQARKSVLNVLASVRRLHTECGFDISGFEAPGLDLWKRALTLTHRHVPQGAPPFPLELLRQLCGRAGSLGTKGVVFSGLLAVLFYSMVRVSSLVPGTRQVFDHTRLPCAGDVSFRTDGTALLRVRWAKNAQVAGQGFTVPLLPVAGSPACPVGNLRRVLGLWERGDLSRPLFAFSGAEDEGGMGYRGFTISLAREWFATLLQAQGIAAGGRGFTLHSLRRGACSLAFRNGARETDLQALGGWRSSAVKCYYEAGDARRRAAEALTCLN